MPRKPPPPTMDRVERARLAGPSLAPANLVGVLGELDFENDEIKTGVIAAVVDTKEIPSCLRMLNIAIRKSEELAMTCWVVRSGSRLYATNVPPLSTKDINALYLIEVVPPLRRDELTRRLFTALQAMVGRLT